MLVRARLEVTGTNDKLLPMPRFLFWNLDGKPLKHRVARMAHHYDVDVLILADTLVSLFSSSNISAGLISHLAVLDSDGHSPLVNKNGHPQRSESSDHLPILFAVNS